MAHNPIIHNRTYGAADIKDQADHLAAELNRPFAPDLIIRNAAPVHVDRFIQLFRNHLRMGWNPASNVLTLDYRGSGTTQEYLSDDDVREKLMLADKHMASTTLKFSGSMKNQRRNFAKVIE